MQARESICGRLVRKLQIVPQHLRMKKDLNPIFIWGCGSYAIHIYNYCKNYQVPITGVFVNVPEAKTTFEDLPVFQMDQVAERYPKFSVIIGHANYIEGTAWLRSIKSVENIYCIASCCYDIWDPIPELFLRENEQTLNEFYWGLQDEASRKCFTSYFESRISDDPSYMFSSYKKEVGYYKNDVFVLGKDETFLDVGACVGNSIWSFVNAVNGMYRSIIALEPDENNCLLLRKSIKDRDVKNVVVKQVCAYDRECFVKFSGEHEKGGIQKNAAQYRLYPAVTIDGLCQELNAGVSLLKINFAFSVSQVLNGAQRLLGEKKPKLIIRAGFDENVLIEIYRTIKDLNPNYQIYLRYTIGIPQGLTIFAL